MNITFPIQLTFLILLMLLSFSSCSKNDNHVESPTKKLNVLLYSKTGAFRHESIEAGGEALKKYLNARQINAVQSEDSLLFTGDKLSTYDVVVFFLTTGNILDSLQQLALMKHIQSGKGFVGIHSAADTEYDWPWYENLVGVRFASHPEIQQATFVKLDTSHISVKHLPERWNRVDEIYNFKELPDSVHVVLGVDETTYQGGTHGDYHPISWYQVFEGGRSFFTAMGHTVENYQDTLFLEHLHRAIAWAGKQ